MKLKSSNGWPASKNREELGIKSYTIEGTSVRIACADAVAPLLVGFLEEFHALIEPIDKGTPDDWGYCFRMVRGSERNLSNHSSGTAIDVNATKHPLGKSGTFPSEKVPMIQALAKKYGLKWGGDYSGRKDEMHFEVILKPAKVAKRIEKLKESK